GPMRVGGAFGGRWSLVTFSILAVARRGAPHRAVLCRPAGSLWRTTPVPSSGTTCAGRGGPYCRNRDRGRRTAGAGGSAAAAGHTEPSGSGVRADAWEGALAGSAA